MREARTMAGKLISTLPRIVAVTVPTFALCSALAMATSYSGTYRGTTSQRHSSAGNAAFLKATGNHVTEVNFEYDAGGPLCAEGDYDTGKGFSTPISGGGTFGFTRYGFTVSGRFLPHGKVEGSFREKPFQENRRTCGTGKVTFTLKRSR